MKKIFKLGLLLLMVWGGTSMYSVSQNTIFKDKLFQDTILITNFLIINRWTKDKIFSYNNYPYVSKENNEGWIIEVIDASQWLVRFKHETSGLYMKSHLDSMFLGSMDKDMDPALWRIEKYLEYYRIAHVKTGLYLNTETGKLSLSKAAPGWFSSHWKLERKMIPIKNAAYWITNRWTNHKLILWEVSPADSLATNDSWIVENLYDMNAAVRLKHMTTGLFLKSFQDSLYAGRLDKDMDGALWRIERYGDYYRLHTFLPDIISIQKQKS
jgi:hypothetical protein